MTKLSQNQAVFKRLKSKGYISRNWAHHNLAIGRLGARIQDLKDDGLIYEVEEGMKKCKGMLGYVTYYGAKIEKDRARDFFYKIVCK